MLVIICPHCGPRNSDEFLFQGEIAPRPAVDNASPAQWRGYLYAKSNLSGWVNERWFHVSGCRRYLMVERHTQTNEIGEITVVGGAS